MTRRHRLLLPVLIATVGLALAGCGGGGDSSSGDTSGNGGQSAAVGDATAGASVFAENCAGCHGSDGQGGVGPNLQESSTAEDYAAVVNQVRNGGGSMPPFSDRLDDQQINDVAAYVKETLAPKA